MGAVDRAKLGAGFGVRGRGQGRGRVKARRTPGRKKGRGSGRDQGARGRREVRASVGVTLVADRAAANGAGQCGPGGGAARRRIWRRSSAVKQCLAATSGCVL